MSVKSRVIDGFLYLAHLAIGFSHFFDLSRIRKHMLLKILDQNIISMHVIRENKVIELWNWEKYTTPQLFYLYIKSSFGEIDSVYPRIEKPCTDVLHVCTFFNNKKTKQFYIGKNDYKSSTIYHHDIVYALLDNHNVTDLVRGLNICMSVELLVEIASNVLNLKVCDRTLKVMLSDTFEEYIFKDSDTIII